MSSSAVLERSPTAEVDGTIPRTLAQVLDLAKQSGSTLTPRELNEQLANIQVSYDALTARFAENSATITSELALLRNAGGVLNGQMQVLHTDVHRQGSALGVLAASASADIDALKTGLDNGLADVHERMTVQVESLHETIGREANQLGQSVRAVEQLLLGQARIVDEQGRRLDQFDVARELLDTAVRGNRKRIEVVREDLETRQAVATAQVNGLAALQREHYAEFLVVKEWVQHLQEQAQTFAAGLRALGETMTVEAQATQRRFRWTHAGMAALLLLLLASMAAVKWLPALTPASVEQDLGQVRADLTQLEGNTAGVPSLEYRTRAHDGQLDQLDRSVATLKQRLSDMQQALNRLNAAQSASMQATPGAWVLRDSDWVMQQARETYTVQLAGVPDPADLTRIAQQIEALPAGQELAYAVTYPGGEPRYNLFFGAFASINEARQALATLPASVQANRPWVRSWGAVQAALR